jgi:hypothetical protein
MEEQLAWQSMRYNSVQIEIYDVRNPVCS